MNSDAAPAGGSTPTGAAFSCRGGRTRPQGNGLFRAGRNAEAATVARVEIHQRLRGLEAYGIIRTGSRARTATRAAVDLDEGD